MRPSPRSPWFATPPPRPVLVLAGAPALRAGARAALRRAGARLLPAATDDDALAAALAHDTVLVLAHPACAGPQAPLRQLLAATGRAGDLLRAASRGTGPGARCDWRGLRRRLRRLVRRQAREQAALAASPQWQRLAASFRSHLRERMGELRAALDRADAPAALVIVHDVKGTAAGYGLGVLTDAARTAQDHFLADEARAGFACCRTLLAQAEEALR